jgi:hypothetical protein
LTSKKTFAEPTPFDTFERRFRRLYPTIDMKKLFALALFGALALAACQNDGPTPRFSANNTPAGLSLLADANPEWQHENLRLYPVVADAALLAAQSNLGHFKTLAEGMSTPGFRVLERKQFGRSEGPWYHAVTVQNKTQDTILMLSGDVLTGGNQDRVMAHHQVILPKTVQNVEVFCVEAGRSHYYDPAAPSAEKELAAFKGYYNVASPQVRRAVQTTGNQAEVWAAVAKVTEANGAKSPTSAYAALDAQSEQKAKRDAYLRFFDDKITDRSDVVGMVAVSGDRVLGVDIFGSPDLFRREYSALLHGYVAEAATGSSASAHSDATAQRHFEQVIRLAAPDEKDSDLAGKFAYNGQWLHLFSK